MRKFKLKTAVAASSSTTAAAGVNVPPPLVVYMRHMDSSVCVCVLVRKVHIIRFNNISEIMS